MANKLEFEVEKDDKKIKLFVVKPSIEIEQKAQIHYAKTFAELIKNGALLREKLKSVVKEQNIWDEAKEKELNEIDARINENMNLLPDANGKVAKKGAKMSELRKAAIQIRIDRLKRINLLRPITKLDENTAEGLAEDAKFNFLISQCVVNEFKKPYFASYEDYRNRSEDLDAIISANKFFELIYGDPVETEKEFPENEFLHKNKMCNDKLSLINKDGQLVDVDGKVIDKLEENKVDEVVEHYEVEDDWV